MNFLSDLVDLFQNDTNLRNWLRSLITNKIDISCRHEDNIPNSQEVCGRYSNLGSNELGKGITIRKSTIWNLAVLHVGRGDPARYPSKVSTKVDVSTLMIPLAYPDENLQDLIIECVHYGWKVLHACGCGCLTEDSCCVPTHLYLGTDGQNRDDRAYHRILKKLDGEEYDDFVNILNKHNEFTF